MILLDGCFINLCTDVQFKHFQLSFPELKSEKWYHVIKWYDDVFTYCSLFGIFVPSFVNIVKTSDSSFGFTCGHSPTDSAPAFLTSKLLGWGQTIYLGIAFAAFKSLPSTSRMKSLLTNHHLLGYRLLHHILQTYHPLYNEDASDNIAERPQQQFYDSTTRHLVKLQTQEYFDAYACYLMLKAYLNNSSKTLVDAAELRIFFLCCIRGEDLYRATCFQQENHDCKYKFLPHNLVQTLLLEFARLSSERHSIECSSSAKRFDGDYRTGSSRGRQSYTPCRPSGSSTDSRILPEHQNEFLTKVINVVKADPSRAFTPDCICCLALNRQEALQKYKFMECPIATDNDFCNKAYISMCHLVNVWRKKSLISATESTTTCDLSLNRLEAILGSSEDQIEDADIESDDESSAGSHTDFCSGNESVHDSLRQH